MGHLRRGAASPTTAGAPRTHAVPVETLTRPRYRQPHDHPSPLRPRGGRQRRLRSQGSALGLPADCSTKTIYQQESSEAPHTAGVFGPSETERGELPDLQRGEGLWRVGQCAFVVRHLATDGELQLFDTTPACSGQVLQPTGNRCDALVAGHGRGSEGLANGHRSLLGWTRTSAIRRDGD